MTTSARLRISLDSSSPEPVFSQVCSAISSEVAFGRLQPGMRLPTTRALAAQLQVAVNTVAKAYRELEIAGVVEGRGRQGTFIVDQSGTAGEREALRFATSMRDLGMTREQALALVERAWG
ncbi:MAG: GntR family transcriptional regulator [Actinomyces sp.]|uniref:GntR family transcriptional regulator n=1 Tax=Actinomyces sp. TaxID=29317 RepID=UPI0026DBA2EA|nr:GntR family transcriptional regulator [Actinomyces sp.]MDO4243664.1 GntR family transcriptional regulator [Actinomyces sp.]